MSDNSKISGEGRMHELFYAFWSGGSFQSASICVDSMDVRLFEAEELCCDAIKAKYLITIAPTHIAFWLTKPDQVDQQGLRAYLESLIRGDKHPKDFGAVQDFDIGIGATLQDFVTTSSGLPQTGLDLSKRLHVVFLPKGTFFFILLSCEEF